ncbi:MAG: YkgJ family cysteine cluster protein, partial [Myxococcaceae bacterium]|nr:YkgJ family cysteine cluster protein [Myxococcaceae bacterium]
EGEVSSDEALAVVDEVHAAIREVAEALPPEDAKGTTPAVMQRARRAAQEGILSSQGREAWQRAEALLDQHLRGRTHRAG